MDESQTDTPAGGGPPILDEVEARLVGCLLEKQATTPELYPLTANAAQQACNQKSSREPIMNLEAGAVGNGLRRLEDKRLVRVMHSARALRYEHCVEQVYGVTPRQRAVLCVLLLRGPQTIAEIQSRTERMAKFADTAEVQDTLERLAERSHPLVVRLGRAPGQREQRYMHLLCGPVDASGFDASERAGGAEAVSGSEAQELAERIAALEREVEGLKQRLDGLGV
jgi:uncharacterized protein YceH (UPF0502 family)